MTRICKLDGCDEPTSPRAEFCKPAHRAAFWRSRHVVAVPVDHPRAGENNRSGSQVSYVKAVDVLAAWLDRSGASFGEMAQREAELILRGALSERQAERERQRERTG